MIQKQYRGYRVRKELGPLTKRKLDVNTVEFIREYCRRWKAKTIFQVLLMYRAARQQDLVYFSQQVHLYNQAVMSGLDKCNREQMSLDSVECGARASLVLGKKRPAVWKLPFRLDQDLPYFDTTYLNDPMISGSGPSLFSEDDHEAWDAPLRRGNFTPWKTDKQITRDKEVQTSFSPTPDDNEQEEHFIQIPFCRDPTEVQSGKLLSQDKTEKPSNINSVTEQKERHTPSPVQPYVHHKRTEVYNPGKARRLEQRYEMDNRAMEKENNNILRDTSPKYNQRNIASPTPQQIRKNSNNSNSRDIDNNMRYSKEKKWESPSSTNKKASNNLKNQYNQQEHVMTSQFINRGGKGHLSSNPIAEMELKGRRSTAREDSDEPPFNFQAMLRKTNTNRASLRRNHEKAPTPEECNSRSSIRSKHTSSVSSMNRSDLKEPSWIENENHEKARIKIPWNETEQWSKYETQQWDKSGSTKSWNDSDNSSYSKKSWYENEQQRYDSMKSDSVKSWNKSEQEDKINSKKTRNELGRSISMESQNEKEKSDRYELSRSISMESQNEKEKSDRYELDRSVSMETQYEKEKSDRYDLYKTDFMSLRNASEESARYGSENSLSQSSLSRSNSKKSLKGNEMFPKTDSKYSEKESSVEGSNSNSKISLIEDKQHLTEKEEKWVSEIETTTTELVPGLIIQGQVADL